MALTIVVADLKQPFSTVVTASVSASHWALDPGTPPLKWYLFDQSFT